jgi:acyl-CoA thioesterase FadM
MQFLKSKGYTELEFAGVGMIMADVAIEFRNELFYGDVVVASIAIASISKVNFDLFYKLEKETAGKMVLVAIAKTGMVCYDYANKKIAAIPEEARMKLQ